MKNEMRKSYCCLLRYCWQETVPLSAQTPQEDFKRDVTLSGSNYVAYRGPQKQLTSGS